MHPDRDNWDHAMRKARDHLDRIEGQSSTDTDKLLLEASYCRTQIKAAQEALAVLLELTTK